MVAPILVFAALGGCSVLIRLVCDDAAGAVPDAVVLEGRVVVFGCAVSGSVKETLAVATNPSDECV